MTVTVTAPPDRTPVEEAELVAQVAAAYDDAVVVVVVDADEPTFAAVGARTGRWGR